MRLGDDLGRVNRFFVFSRAVGDGQGARQECEFVIIGILFFLQYNLRNLAFAASNQRLAACQNDRCKIIRKVYAFHIRVNIILRF